ncbi:hypothetical protein PV08_06599 [Exophiala spinifera]|uniref:C2H2-type domain-containing protein n=1 Tax=Exophiala spinifera TaxID=91928 RepID=A0A0D2BRC9_9EURO|nr:uncharacterized protein PV08_06599 [Exophiala spinifera]KIW13819.1 hypothetical protein PV08_06599 [Exophiala spinifera]
MLALEHSNGHQCDGFDHMLDRTVKVPFPGLVTYLYKSADGMNTNFHPLPYSYLATPAMFATAPQTLKHEVPQFHDRPPALISSGWIASVPSVDKGAMGSPDSAPSHTISSQDNFDHTTGPYGLEIIAHQDSSSQDMLPPTMEADFSLEKLPDSYVEKVTKQSARFLDPSLVYATRSFGETAFSKTTLFQPNMNTFTNLSPTGSPALPPQPYSIFPTTQFSDPPIHSHYYPQEPQQDLLKRRPSPASSVGSHSSSKSEPTEEGVERGRCPHPECGKVFKDLKAHLLTHRTERPEKCPIPTCEYRRKGFARKYDKNRHALTHFKGTMVCAFCPSSGFLAEKRFYRAVALKRHLTSVHGVELTAPNSRKRSPTVNSRMLSSHCQDANGKCSTCSATFINAQSFYEHLDDCVLRVVQQEEPSEAINAHRLASIPN